MKTTTKIASAIAVALLSAQAVPVLAQEPARQEVQVYGGALFGDRITDVAVSGQRPELDDAGTFGLRYAYGFNDNFGLELSAGYSPEQVKKLAGGKVDLDLYTIDLDAVWNFNTGSVLTPYVLAGAGYAVANLDRPLVGVVNGQSVTLNDDDGFTLNAAAGLKYAVTDHVVLRGEVRYRYLDKVVDRYDHALNTVETTLGVGVRF
jgi:outer membrane beta-barrel protein